MDDQHVDNRPMQQPPPKPRRRPSRRGNGEGTIFQRTRPDGRPGLWQATISLGKGEDGKRRRLTVYADTKREVLEKLATIQSQKIEGKIADPCRMTVAQYLDHWLKTSAADRCRPSTLSGYGDVIRLHINPHVGGVSLKRLSPAHVDALYSVLRKAGTSDRQRQYVHAILRRALSRALVKRMIPSNPCDCVDRPKVAKKEMKFLTGEQVARFLDAAESDRLYAMYVLAIGTGMRQGELFGLKWEDVDLKARRVSVRRTLVEIKGKTSIGEPKSAKSRRTITMSASVTEALEDHRARMLKEGNLSRAEFVFCSTEGNPLRKSNVHRRSFRPILKRANKAATEAAEKAGTSPELLPTIRFHDLRHTNATALLEAGTHVKVVQERMGHSQISMTLDVYSHTLQRMDEAAADGIDHLTVRRPKAAAGA